MEKIETFHDQELKMIQKEIEDRKIELSILKERYDRQVEKLAKKSGKS